MTGEKKKEKSTVVNTISQKRKYETHLVNRSFSIILTFLFLYYIFFMFFTISTVLLMDILDVFFDFLPIYAFLCWVIVCFDNAARNADISDRTAGEPVGAANELSL